jgi:ubiquinone/menaquinone biosynthesis C-methylase UbiE
VTEPASPNTTSPEHGVPERIDPLKELPGVVAHHLKKYEFAKSQIGGTVLDVACGVGYGSEFLGPACDRIVGLEIASEAIEIARARYRHDNVWFVQADAEHLPAADSSADAVTCFEGIEHFGDPEAHLAEVARVLKPEGLYFVSTPHPAAHVHGDDNPFHLHEFDPTSFEELLRRRFGSVSMFGQFRVQTKAHQAAQRFDKLGLRRMRWLRPFTKAVSRSALKTTPTEEATLDDFEIRTFQGEASEYIAVCSQPKGS